MDSLVAAAARALARGDPLGALGRVGQRDDAPALALRGIAMAQLGDHPRARELLRRAARAFGTHEEVARARCVVAEAEVALLMRDLHGSSRALTSATASLERHADHGNAQQARLVLARRSLLLGRLDEAAATLAGIDASRLSPVLVAALNLVSAELALRSLRVEAARAAIVRADEAASIAGIPSLLAEVAGMRSALEQNVARRIVAGVEQALTLADVADVLASGDLVVDACRRRLHRSASGRSLAGRPVLFELVRMLAEAAPGDVDRRVLIAQVFRTRRPDETHRARLRVEIGRLRALIGDLARIEATPRGYALRPADDRHVVVLRPPIDGEQASLLALLADGAPWSTSALALALGTSQRTVQRALGRLEHAGRVRSIGRARARRWLAPPLSGFATTLLLPGALPPA
jgi:hypothetical protein